VELKESEDKEGGIEEVTFLIHRVELKATNQIHT